MRLYQVMNKDKVVASFTDGGSLDVYGRLPYGVDANIFSVSSWLEGRLKLLCVRHPKEFLSGIGINSVFDAVYITSMVSLSDSFWVRDAGSGLKWEDVSPFRRGYSEVVSRYALDGIPGLGSGGYFSPVIGTDGSFPHTWKREGGGIRFIKGSSRYTIGGANSGNEPYSEYYAGKVAGYLGFDHVDYAIRSHRRGDGRLDVVTECSCYTTEEYGAVSADRLEIRTYEDLIGYCHGLGMGSYMGCLSMLFLDCLLLNTDRHMGNVEFLVDNDSLKVVRLAPIFDNNYALLPRFMEGHDQFNRGDYVARDGRSFDDLYRLLCSHRDYRRELGMLRRYRFTSPGSVPISVGRLRFLNSFLRMQVGYLSGGS